MRSTGPAGTTHSSPRIDLYVNPLLLRHSSGVGAVGRERKPLAAIGNCHENLHHERQRTLGVQPIDLGHLRGGDPPTALVAESPCGPCKEGVERFWPGRASIRRPAVRPSPSSACWPLRSRWWLKSAGHQRMRSGAGDDHDGCRRLNDGGIKSSGLNEWRGVEPGCTPRPIACHSEG